MKFFQATEQRVADSWYFFKTLGNLVKENAVLQSEVNRLFEENVYLKEVALENIALRQRLKMSLPEAAPAVLAEITGTLAEEGQYFLVDQGEADGVKVGAAAVNENNFFVGQVIEVGRHWAKILLAIDGRSEIGAQVQETRVRGLVRGRNGLSLIFEMVPADATLNIGETVITSGLNDGFPSALVLGRLAEIEKKPNEVFQRAIIDPLIDWSRLEKVFILLP